MIGSLSNYKATKVIGEGMYGKVFLATNLTNDEQVAIKKVKLDNENEGVPATTIREIVLLKDLKHENIVELKSVIMEKGIIGLIFEYCEEDLFNFIYNNHPEGIKDIAIIKSILKQLLCGIKHGHKNMVLHRDLKPSNILRASNDKIKIADFGLSIAFGIPHKYHPYKLVTFIYRCPEIFLGCTKYTTAVDIWSVGGIFAELYTGKPLFNSSKDEEDIHLRKIYSIGGTPSIEDWPEIVELPEYEEIKEELPKQNLQELIEGLDDEAGNLLESMLELNPKKRITAADALNHPFLSEFIED